MSVSVYQSMWRNITETLIFSIIKMGTSNLTKAGSYDLSCRNRIALFAGRRVAQWNRKGTREFPGSIHQPDIPPA